MHFESYVNDRMKHCNVMVSFSVQMKDKLWSLKTSMLLGVGA